MLNLEKLQFKSEIAASASYYFLVHFNFDRLFSVAMKSRHGGKNTRFGNRHRYNKHNNNRKSRAPLTSHFVENQVRHHSCLLKNVCVSCTLFLLKIYVGIDLRKECRYRDYSSNQGSSWKEAFSIWWYWANQRHTTTKWGFCNIHNNCRCRKGAGSVQRTQGSLFRLSKPSLNDTSRQHTVHAGRWWLDYQRPCY